MSKSKGNLSLRLTRTSSGTIASYHYRGPQGKQTVANLGFVDMQSPSDRKKLADALDVILSRSSTPEEITA